MALRLDRNEYRPRAFAGGAASDVEKPKTVWIPSPNFSGRPGGASDIDTIVLHHTAGGGTAEDVGHYFQKPSAGVSSHYIVGKDGTIVQSVPDGKASWHAGKSVFKGRSNVNDFSIGIEIVNKGDNHDPYPDKQYAAIADLVAWLMKAYDVPMDRITGHRDVALPKGRKTDPSDNFDWERVKKLVRERLDGKAAPAPAPPPPQQAPAPPVPATPYPVPPPPRQDLEVLPFDQLLAQLHSLIQQSDRMLEADRAPSPAPAAPASRPPAPEPARPAPEPPRPVADPGKPGGSGPLLKRGCRGDAVKSLQSRLAELGFDPGPVDGIFGPRTEAAVKAFQTDRRIEIDGIVGPQTWGKLGIEVTGGVQHGDPGQSLEIGHSGEMATVQGYQMTPGTAKAFVEMAQAASRAGITLRINSAYRSDAHQARLWEEALRKYGSADAARKWVAPPGHSQHRTGKALDIHTTDAIYAWLKAHAPSFGFKQPMSWEPWHWEFQG